MAERQPAKAKKRSLKAAVAMGTAATAISPGDRLGQLEAERDRLAAELEAAKARIKVLEQAHDRALNHIDWVIDSLHSLDHE